MKAMKKLTLCILVIFSLTAVLFGLTACLGEEEEVCQHEFGEWETVTEATCIAAGLERRVCQLDETHFEERATALLEHTFVDFVSNNDATCTVYGTKTAYCETPGCNATKTEIDLTAILEHSFTEKIAKEEYLVSEADCFNKATYHTSCACGEVGHTTFEYGDYKHEFSEEYKSTPETHWFECECGKKSAVSEHNFNEGEVVAEPTCTEEGTLKFVCLDCSLVIHKPIPVKHTLVLIPKKDATCLGSGIHAHYECSVEGCGKLFRDDVGLEAIEDETEIIDNDVPAHEYAYRINEEDGTHTKYCKNCNTEIETGEHNFEEALDSDYHWLECTECSLVTEKHDHTSSFKQNSEYHWYECSCGYVGNMFKHSANLEDAISIVPPTCEADGSATLICDCLVEFTIVLPAKHTLVLVPATDADCVSEGNIAYYVCSECPKTFLNSDATGLIENIEDTVIPALGHDFDLGIYESNEDGHFIRCGRCNDENAKTLVEAHVYADGYNSAFHFVKCEICGYYESKAAHNLTARTTSYDHYFSCECGYTTVPEDHEWCLPEELPEGFLAENGIEDTSKAPTCFESGEQIYVCIVCQRVRTDEIIALHQNINHIEEFVTYYPYTEPTCEAAGNVECLYCETCERYYTDSSFTLTIEADEVAIKSSHDFQSGIWVIDEANNSHAKKCANCSALTEWAEHDVSGYQADATTHYIGCKCGYVKPGEEISEHSYVYTEIDENLHSYVCEVCKYESGEIEHVFVYDKDPTSHVKKCACGLEYAREPHTLVQSHNNASHYDICECGYTENKEDHDLILKRSAEEHWYQCSGCDFETGRESHSFDVCHDTTKHWHKCLSCGFKTDSKNHYLVSMSDEAYFWSECNECTYETEKIKKEIAKED